jgi:hypothetical protein
MKQKSGLQFTIELDADEAQEFRRRAKTDNPMFYDGIAKALVLGVCDVVDPKSVCDDIDLLIEIAEYGRQGDLAASQDWADALSYTRRQLEHPLVRDMIASWATYYGDDISEIANARSTPHTDQLAWAKLGTNVSSLTDILRRMIGRAA